MQRFNRRTRRSPLRRNVRAATRRSPVRGRVPEDPTSLSDGHGVVLRDLEQISVDELDDLIAERSLPSIE